MCLLFEGERPSTYRLQVTQEATTPAFRSPWSQAPLFGTGTRAGIVVVVVVVVVVVIIFVMVVVGIASFFQDLVRPPPFGEHVLPV
jgi:hypothetical protein